MRCDLNSREPLVNVETPQRHGVDEHTMRIHPITVASPRPAVNVQSFIQRGRLRARTIGGTRLNSVTSVPPEPAMRSDGSLTAPGVSPTLGLPIRCPHRAASIA